MSEPEERSEANRGFSYEESVGPSEAGRALLDHMTTKWRHSPLVEWLRRIDAGEVLVDSRPGSASEILRCGSRIVWKRPPWVEPRAPLDFAILHRDEQLFAVAKPSGLPTLPGGGYLESSLLRLVQRRCAEASPLHRLGRGTSGIVLFARNKSAAAFVQGCWSRRVRKLYRALVAGTVSSDSFQVDVPIGPVPHASLGFVHAASREGKPSRSLVTVLERRESVTLVDVEIETGRPHQIRIHLAAAGHPLVGDPLYLPGGLPEPSGTALPGDLGYLLHAHELVLPHPKSSRILEIRCAPPPLLRALHLLDREAGKGWT